METSWSSYEKENCLERLAKLEAAVNGEYGPAITPGLLERLAKLEAAVKDLQDMTGKPD